MRHEEVWLFDTGTAVVEMLLLTASETLTGARLGSAALSLSPASLTVFPSELRHRSVAVSYSGDLSFSTGH